MLVHFLVFVLFLSEIFAAKKISVGAKSVLRREVIQDNDCVSTLCF